MRLLLNKDLAQQKNNLHDGAVLIISARPALREAVTQQIAGMVQVKELDVDFLSGSGLNLPTNVYRVLIDIGNCTDVDAVINRVKSQIPQHCWCMLLGEIDSIRVAQGFIDRGVRYFHMGSQLAEMAQRVIAGPGSDLIKRQSVLITVLGCKGGVGTSLLSWQLARSIVQYRKLPLLLLQGSRGSQDLDIMVGKKIEQGGIVSGQENTDVMLIDSVLPPDRDAPELQKYNFMVFDQALFNVSKEQMVQQAELSSCILLVIDRSMASVRIALNFIKEFERVSNASTENKRLFICLNDHRPVTPGLLAVSDIESLLGKPVSVSFPYLKAGGDAILEHTLWSGRRKPLEMLTKMILAMDDSNQQSFVYRVWQSLMRKFS